MPTPDNFNAIGRHPVINLLLSFGGIAGAGALLLLLGYFGSDDLFQITVILCVLGGLAALTLLGGSLAAAHANSGIYQAAREAVRAGFTPSYVGRDRLCSGIFMVDLVARRFYLNGRILPFAAVADVTPSFIDGAGVLNFRLLTSLPQEVAVPIDGSAEAVQALAAKVRISIGWRQEAHLRGIGAVVA